MTLPRGPPARWASRQRVRVRLAGGTLASVSDAALLRRRQLRRCARPDGAWEVLQFANAELVGDRTYALSRLLRGQAGSEWAMAAPLPAGAPFVLLDQQSGAVGARPRRARPAAAAARRRRRHASHGDPTALALTVTPEATALRPLAPVHLQARRGGDGVHFQLDPAHAHRRRLLERRGAARRGERAYALDILSGATVVRSIVAATPSALYAAADELADFGAPQSSLQLASRNSPPPSAAALRPRLFSSSEDFMTDTPLWRCR